MSEGIPETSIFYDPATVYYGFSTSFPGQLPHYTIDIFNSVEDVVRCCDPHRERVWDEASDGDETKLLISRDFEEGTVAWRMAHLTLAELSGR